MCIRCGNKCSSDITDVRRRPTNVVNPVVDDLFNVSHLSYSLFETPF